MSERIASTRSFISRTQKRVERARQDAANAREAVASQEKEEGLLAEGERRLEQSFAEERATPSPFTAPPGLPVVPTVSAEVSRLLAIIDSLQEEMSHLRVGVVRSTATDEDDDDAVADLPHKKSRVTPSVITGGRAPQTPPAITGGDGQGSTQSR